ERAHRAEVAHDAGPHLARAPARRARLVLAGEVAVRGADRERRGDGDVGQAEPAERAADELLARARRGDPLAHVKVQDGAAGVLALELLLALERLERVVREADGELGGVRVVRVRVRARLEDPG